MPPASPDKERAGWLPASVHGDAHRLLINCLGVQTFVSEKNQSMKETRYEAGRR